METAGIADFRDAFSRIFKKTAGLKDADAVEMIHNGTLGGGPEQTAEMVFCNIKMICDIIQGSDGAVILIDISDKLGNKGSAGLFRLVLRYCGLAVGLGKEGKDSDKGRISAVEIIFCTKGANLEQERKNLLIMFPGEAEPVCPEAGKEKRAAFFRKIPIQIAFVKIHKGSFIARPSQGFVHAVGGKEGNVVFLQGAGVIQRNQRVFPLLQKKEFVGIMVVKTAHIIVLDVFCVFYLDHFFRGIEVIVHGRSFAVRRYLVNISKIL